MKIVSFNIRFFNDPNGNTIKERSERLKVILDKYNADIVGFQESVPEWLDFIKKGFGEKYEIFNRYRDTSSLESTPILWKKERFECIDKGYFWLSDTPHIQSDGWDELKCKRICIWARLRDRENGKILNFLNTHYGFGNECQLKSSDLLIKTVRTMPGDYTVITGDFNATPDSPAYKRLSEFFTDVNAATVKDFGTTYHNYGKINEGQHIDYCFISGNAVPVNSQIIRDLPDGNYPSDHYGLLSETEQ